MTYYLYSERSQLVVLFVTFVMQFNNITQQNVTDSIAILCICMQFDYYDNLIFWFMHRELSAVRSAERQIHKGGLYEKNSYVGCLSTNDFKPISDGVRRIHFRTRYRIIDNCFVIRGGRIFRL